ncbi:MAG: deoxyguanosinetriphosphate triphosphohydrolase [Candidatus Riflebacteria bacterium]|nr:deoxyguanosinetriphosphate triphosphohydrolase [Candidatus Riflebacteria bacterium]
MIDHPSSFEGLKIEDDSIRRSFEDAEEKLLSSRARLAKHSLGRETPEEECFLRTCFQRDRDRIIHSEAFRRLKHKTQVFLSPTHDHFRTRLTHTLEVAGIARTIARALRLNEDLTEAIAFGHDLGHTPFGHAGEQILAEICEGGFHHASHSVRVVCKLEKNGLGLNLTREVIDGILKHSKGRSGAILSNGADESLTLEGQIVRISDLVAYVNHDVDDAIKAGIISLENLPSSSAKILGPRHSKRIHQMVKDIISASYVGDKIAMSQPFLEATNELRAFLYEKVYTHPAINSQVETSGKLLRQLARWFQENPDDFKKRYCPPHVEISLNRSLTDFLAGLTDAHAINLFQDIYVPLTHLDNRFIKGYFEKGEK